MIKIYIYEITESTIVVLKAKHRWISHKRQTPAFKPNKAEKKQILKERERNTDVLEHLTIGYLSISLHVFSANEKYWKELYE